MRNTRGSSIGIVIYLVAAFLLSDHAVNAQDGSVRPPQPGQLRTDASDSKPDPASVPPPVEQKRLFGIIPNYRTFSRLQTYAPLTSAQKFSIARQDAFDRGTIILAAAFAGQAQLTRSDPSFGNGAQAYGRYFITSYADYAIGDFMTEGIFPTMFRQDPRYFRKGDGGSMGRIGYSIAQLFYTRTDSGGHAFNISEVGGNATAVAISQAYYPDNRNASDAISKLGTQIGVDMASNILKEFSPDIYRLFSRRKHQN